MEKDWRSEVGLEEENWERAPGHSDHFNITHMEGVIKEGKTGGWKKKKHLKSLKAGWRVGCCTLAAAELHQGPFPTDR